MSVQSRVGRPLVTVVAVSFVIAALMLPLFALASQVSARSAAQSTNSGRADSYGDLFNAVLMNDIRSARDLAMYSDVTEFYQQVINKQATWPEVTGAYLFGAAGRLRFALDLDPVGTAVVPWSLPVGLNVHSPTVLGRTLANTLRHNAEGHVLSFGANTGSMGNIFLYEPVTDLANHVMGAVVLRVDNQTLFGNIIGKENVLLVAPPFIVSRATPSMVARHQVQVLAGTPASELRDPSIVSGVTPVVDTNASTAAGMAQDSFQYQSQAAIGGLGRLDNLSDFHALVYSPAPTFLGALGQTATSGVGLALIILLASGAAVLVIFQEGRAKTATATLEERRARLLTEDVLNVSQALTVAREGDLTVEVPPAESEVGLIALMVNGLLDDYSQMVADIIRASRAVQQGALRIDDGVRTVVEIASRQSEDVTATAGTVEALSASAATVQEATRQATDLAAAASHSVQLGQGAVGRIGEAVDSIKEAAIGTTREFKRLQEDSIRLTALVSSVKNNAENLDMQAANAALEARHLGTETGSAFATNIGRLARQAQETLADAESAVRSVVTSIDAVNRRIERISEQVRLGVDEVRSVRSNFEDITTTNHSLVQFIEQVAASAQAQAANAQRVASSITAVATTFQQFNEMLISSGDEMAHMRLIVADLQDSVSTLKVDETLLVEAGAAEAASSPSPAAGTEPVRGEGGAPEIAA